MKRINNPYSDDQCVMAQRLAFSDGSLAQLEDNKGRMAEELQAILDSSDSDIDRLNRIAVLMESLRGKK